MTYTHEHAPCGRLRVMKPSQAIRRGSTAGQASRRAGCLPASMREPVHERQVGPRVSQKVSQLEAWRRESVLVSSQVRLEGRVRLLLVVIRVITWLV